MSYYVGKVVALDGQRARVAIERKKGDGSHVPRVLDCWNVCEAKRGARVRVERQTMDEKKGRWLMRSIPVLCLVAGAAFGRAVAPYSPLSPWLTAVLSAAVWLLLGWNYVHTFARDVAHRGEQWSITGYYSEVEIPEADGKHTDGEA